MLSGGILLRFAEYVTRHRFLRWLSYVASCAAQ